MNEGKTAEFVWNELVTHDPAASAEYYSKVFGWQTSTMNVDPSQPPYTVLMAGEKMIAGILQANGQGLEQMEQSWMAYLEVPDVDAVVAAVRANGGSVVKEPFDVPTVGRIAAVRDPMGGLLGIMTSQR